ncbi:MAG TPA: hypothetical protein VFS44_11650 [Gemmatimonadaceae bacterium]|nr:hypothetical protein [Gemmatimonadaceae bacterium]
MRTVRWLASGLALVALLPAVGAAQSSRLFKNSWFWGAKVGLMSYSTAAQKNSTAASIGAEWLITRSRGALYVAGEQAFFDATSAVQDNASAPNAYRVSIKDMRRYTAAALAFPVAWGTLRPYAGVGFSLNLIQHATLADPVADTAQLVVVQNRIANQKDRIAFITMAGVQAQYRRVSLFGQLTYMPAKENFLLNGRTTYMLESGVRYNFGSSVDQPR